MEKVNDQMVRVGVFEEMKRLFERRLKDAIRTLYAFVPRS